jgi:metallo-beta-lactamase class B
LKNLKFLALLMIGLLSACSTKTPGPVSPKPSQQIELADGLMLSQIGHGVYVVTHSYPWPANSLIVQMSNGDWVMAGTPYTPDATRQVLAWVEENFGKSKFTAIDTGYHIDNLGGNQALVEAGIPVYGSDLTVRMLQERGERTRQYLVDMAGDPNSPYAAEIKSMEFVPPDHVFPADDGLTLTFGDEKVQVIYPGPTQAPDKLAVYFPDRKLLFGSCMVLGNDQLGNTTEADFDNWPLAIAKLQQLPADVVIPGHGDRFSADVLQHTLDLLAIE